jgi:hypothetical protein
MTIQNFEMSITLCEGENAHNLQPWNLYTWPLPLPPYVGMYELFLRHLELNLLSLLWSLARTNRESHSTSIQ